LITKRPKPLRERIQVKKQHRNTKPVLEPDRVIPKVDTERNQGAKLRSTFHQHTPANRRSHGSGAGAKALPPTAETLPQEWLSRQQVETRRQHPGVRDETQPDWQKAMMNECTSCSGTSSSSFADLEPKSSQAARHCQSSRSDSNH
jgi:hypothetical protein